MRATFQLHHIKQKYLNALSDISKVINHIPDLFNFHLSIEISNLLRPKIWITNSAVKKTFLKNASEQVLNPLFEQISSEYFQDTFKITIKFIRSYLDKVSSKININLRKTLIQSMIFGFDVGLVNCCFFDSNSILPIKLKRLQILINFYDQIHKEFVSEFQNEGIFFPKTKYLVDHLQTSLSELIEHYSQQSDYEQSLLLFILISSHNNNRNSQQWTESNKIRFQKQQFGIVC